MLESNIPTPQRAGGFDRGHPDVLLRPTDHGSNVHSSRTANSERATTRNVAAMAILHRRTESGASRGGKEIKNTKRQERGKGRGVNVAEPTERSLLVKTSALVKC